jgi:hypothetical protein
MRKSQQGKSLPAAPAGVELLPARLDHILAMSLGEEARRCQVANYGAYGQELIRDEWSLPDPLLAGELLQHKIRHIAAMD